VRVVVSVDRVRVDDYQRWGFGGAGVPAPGKMAGASLGDGVQRARCSVVCGDYAVVGVSQKREKEDGEGSVKVLCGLWSYEKKGGMRR
jgi:hypothetical protein